MTGIKMVNGVKLSTGETVDGYYLDEEGYATLVKAGNIDARIINVWDRLGEVSRAVFKVQEV